MKHVSILLGLILFFVASISKINAIFTRESKYQTSPHTEDSIEIPGKLVNFLCPYLNIDRIKRCFLPIPEPGTISAIPLPNWEQQACAMIESVSSVE